MSNRAFNVVKNWSNDRVLVLERVLDKPILNTSGIPDRRLFTGENKLHAILDTQTMMWTLRYDHGIAPEPFKQKFTSFTKLQDFVTDYFKRRNVNIVKVVDAEAS